MSKQYPPLVLELIDRKPSSFVLKGTENTADEQRLDTSSIYLLLNFSYNLIPGKKNGDPKVQKTTRWIAGQDEILIEKQEELNMIYNPLRDIISFSFGNLIVEREGDKVGLYDFLKNYDGNISNKNRPVDAPPIFREINTSVEAEELVGNVSEEAEALSLVTQHVKAVKGNNGVKTYHYNSERLAWLCKLFNLSTDGEDSSMVTALVAKARNTPGLFIQTVEDADSDIKVVIITAKDLGIILLDGDKSIFTEDQSVIIPLKGKSMNDKVKELAEFLSSPEGELLNSSLRTKVEYAKSEMLKKK